MNNQDLILNIAVNLGRLGKWGMEKRTERIAQFLEDSKRYLDQIDEKSLNQNFQETYKTFLKNFDYLQNNPAGDDWAETAFTWANILTHRAKLT